MSRKNLLLLFVAIIIATLLSYLIFKLIGINPETTTPSQPQPKHEAKEYPVLIANKTLLIGSILQSGDIAWKSWPREALSSGYIIEGTREIDDFYGSVVRDPISSGQPIISGALVFPEDGGYLASLIRPGKRAISIQVDKAAGKAALLTPGDYVDIILTRNAVTKSARKTESSTILRNIRVLATDSNLLQNHSEPSKNRNIDIVTIEVTPEQAETITGAQNIGQLSLSVRGIGATEYEDQLDDLPSDSRIVNITIIRGVDEFKSQAEPNGTQ